jgi:hypothetical protein
MLQAMSCVARLGTELTLLERGLFSRAYHYVIDEKCKARRILASFQLQERKKGNLKAEKAAMEFRLKVEAEIEEACYLVVNIIDKQLLPVSSSSADNLVFYHQMYTPLPLCQLLYNAFFFQLGVPLFDMILLLVLGRGTATGLLLR